jgi:acyl carrier protein
MSSVELMERVRSAIGEVLKLDSVTLSPTSGAGDFHEWDSLGHLIVVSALETRFNVTFTTEEILNTRTVGDFVGLLESRQVADRPR